MLYTGFRVSDTINLKKRDIQQSGAFKTYITEKKTQKKRELIIPRWLRDEILYYAKKYHMRSEDFLFPSTLNNRCKHISRSQVFRVFKKIAAETQMQGVISPHSCRKWYARAEYEKHKDLNALQKDLRHTNVQTTIGYLADI
jgi:integrase